MWEDFKEFAFQGNVIDLAVAVVIGGAFGQIVNSLVENIIMPSVGALLSGISFEGLSYTVGNAEITYGVFIQSVFDFFVIAIRSEEHTSELQSRGHLVCRLLLE